MLMYSLSSPAPASVVVAVTRDGGREEQRWGGLVAELDRQRGRDRHGGGDELD
jgi:hypothetical protein